MPKRLSCLGAGGDRAFLMLPIRPNNPAKPLDAFRVNPPGGCGGDVAPDRSPSLRCSKACALSAVDGGGRAFTEKSPDSPCSCLGDECCAIAAFEGETLRSLSCAAADLVPGGGRLGASRVALREREASGSVAWLVALLTPLMPSPTASAPFSECWSVCASVSVEVGPGVMSVASSNVSYGVQSLDLRCQITERH